MRFKAGMLGCCIVVLSLLGTVASGFFLGVEPSTRDVTKYDFITDVTGLFDITQAPEYIEYSPANNYVGYSPALAIDYSPSSTVNNYRYITAEGTTATSSYTITKDSSFPSDTGRFSPSDVGTSAFVNWNGAINFGSTVTFQGIEYNMTTARTDLIPMITSLARVIDALNLGTYNTLSIDVTYGAFPVIFYYGNWTFNDIERGDGDSQYIYSATMNESNTMPDHLDVNMATGITTAYRNGVQMWNVNASQVDVIYNYSTRASGNFNQANSSANFSITAKTFPTYGYMDPTRGISMDASGPTSVFHITPNDNYAVMSGLFNTPDIPYPDSQDTGTQNITNLSGASAGLSTGLFSDDGTRARYLLTGTNVYATDTTDPNTGKVTPLYSSLGNWLRFYINANFPGSDLDDFSSISVDVQRYNSYDKFPIVTPANISVLSQTSSRITYQTQGNVFPTSITVDCSTELAEGYYNDTLLWAYDVDEVALINSRTNVSTSSDVPGALSLDMTFYGIPGATTGPSYPILYIDKADDYGGAVTGHLTISGQDVNTAVYIDVGTNTLNLTSLSTIFNAWNLSASDSYIIEMDHGNYPIYMAPKTPEVWTYLTVGDYTQPWAKYYYTAGSGAPYTVVDRLVYDGPAGTVRAYTDGTLRWTADPQDVWVAYKYFTLDGSSDVPSVYQGAFAPVDTTVTLRSIIDGTATWENGYSNDRITLTVQRYSLNGNDMTITAGSSYATVLIDQAGSISVTDGTTTLSMGKWKGIQITIDATAGTLAVTPSNNLSYTSPITENNTTKYIENWYSGGDITSLSFSTTGQTPYWQVTQTTVFLDTFSAVMYDPKLNIKDYFPDIDNWRLNFYSFATYGDSLTINNIPFTVNRTNGTVTWNLEENGIIKTYTAPLNNIYITDQDVDGTEHLMLSFVNDKKTYDLGAKVTDTITFTGLWFFTTGLYQAVTVTESYYDWILDSAWHIEPDQAILIFLGLLVLMSLLAKGLFKISFKSLDGVVVIGAGFIIALFLGGL